MGRFETTVTTFECDFKCGAIEEVSNKALGSLNHAHVPKGWEKIYRVPTGYMTTDADSAKIPYVLCPKCFRLFEVLAHGKTTGMGARFRTFTDAFWENEKVLEAAASQRQSTFKASNYGDLGDGIDND